MLENVRGIIPPMVTPFAADGALDLPALRRQTRFLIDHGIHGLCPGGSTGEGEKLDVEELRQVVATVAEEAAGRVPVVAGIIVDSTRQAIACGRAVADLGVAALQVTPVHYLWRPDDAHMLAHFHALAEAIRLPILIYNVVPWSYLSPALLCRIMREVPLVAGVKQSNGDLKLLADLLVMAPEGKRIITAVDPLLYPAFALGAHGAIGAMLTAAPGPCVALWNAVERGDHTSARALHESLLGLWNTLAGDNLPATVKAALALQGCDGGHPRAPMAAASADKRRMIRDALARLGRDVRLAAAD